MAERRLDESTQHADVKEECRQGPTLVHFLAQLEPCLTPENTLHILNTP